MVLDASSSKFKRLKRHGERKYVCTGEDRISSLPDAILCHILSFLPTAYAVRSSILSKRWIYLWTSVPCVEIDDLSSLIGDWERFCSPEMKNLFMDFVDRVLRLSDVPCLQKFKLRCIESYNASRVSEWISAVIMRDIEELDLDFFGVIQHDPSFLNRWVEFPLTNIFTTKTLVILKLKDLFDIHFYVPTSVYLPSLKIFHFHSSISFDDESMKILLAGCPVIEELDLNTGAYLNMKPLFVRSSSLKSLTVKMQGFMDDQLIIVVDAINLERLDLKDSVPIHCDVSNLSSLIKVKLDLCKRYVCESMIGRDVCGNGLVQLLRKLSNTKYLFLSSEIMKCLEYARLDDLPVFPNLTHLELTTLDYRWPVLPCLLERSPNLIAFIFHKEQEPQAPEQHLQFQEPKCLMMHLEVFELTGFKGRVDEMEMVKYFLKNATVLKKLSIHSSQTGSEEQLDISKKLLTYAWGSTACQIILH